MRWLALFLMVAPLEGQLVRARTARAQGGKDVKRIRDSWRVLDPITRRNLSIYPLVSNLKVGTSEFLTLDEGVAAGVVRIAERGQLESAIYRRRDSRLGPVWGERRSPFDEASVNELVLVNESARPLILLAGEVVSGGKQNRIIGADLVVPPKSDPLPLTVFCVEHGRWSAGGNGFGTAKAMAHPAIRMEAQVAKSQNGVWSSVARSADAFGAAPVASPTSSYLDVLNSPQAKRAVDEAASSIEAKCEGELREEMRGSDAIGIIVAINGELVWSDVFPSAELFRKYWSKLLRSYVMEAQGREPAGGRTKGAPSVKDAEVFLREESGRVTIKEEPEAYRRTEISTEDYQIVALEALNASPDSGLLVHYNKMARD